MWKRNGSPWTKIVSITQTSNHSKILENDFRKIQDKFKSTKEAVEQDMSTGNKSKYEGNLSELYRIILQMVREEEDAKEEKESQKELKRKLDDNTDQVLSSDNKKMVA